MSARGLMTDAEGLTFGHVDEEEAAFLYEEIFVRRSYLQHGLTVPTGAPVILDIGANIGLFSLLCLRLNPRARVLACEPSPDTFGVLEANLSAAPRAHREDAMKLSPSDEFDFEDELKVSPPRPPPSPEAEEDETAREEIARASQRLDELKGRVEEFVLDSTELLLDTITTTNDYLLLFNPKLMLKLRTIKAEAVEWLDRAESKTKTKD